MKVIFPSTLDRWAARFPVAAVSLGAWRVSVEGAKWRIPSDIKVTWSRYSRIKTNCDTAGLERVICDISGTDYRLVTHVGFAEVKADETSKQHGAIFLRWFGSHAEYDKVDWKNSEETNYE